MNKSKLVFSIENFDEYFEEMHLSADENGMAIDAYLIIPHECYDEEKGEWNDERIEKFVRNALRETFGARATVSNYDEPCVIASDILPPAYHYTL